MPARLQVLQGAEPGRELPIEDEVLRLGGAAVCEVRFGDAGLAAHAATLEFRDGQYYLHNRAPEALRLGEQFVAPRGVTVWKPGQNLYLTDQLVLHLVVDGDPAPARQQAPQFRPILEPEELEPAPPSTESPAPAKDRTRTAIQMAVILGSIAAVAYLLLTESENTPAPARNTPGQFNRLIEELQKAEPAAVGQTTSLSFLLQDARISRLRGDSDRARQQYGQVLDLLNRKSQLTETEQKARAFVMEELRTLPGSAAETGSS